MADSVTAAMQTCRARQATFESPQQISKRRASSQSRKKAAQTLEWPHEYPGAEQLAQAGFFYKPTQESPDNVQCFLCGVKLDGWEATDNPLQEHLAHSRACAWAKSQSVARQDGDEEETRDPLSAELVLARQGTFEAGVGWAHEGRKGWKCKIAKMVDAGWCFDPSPETEDGVTCFYCTLSLDGWEPKDDPFEEHRRRGPDCPFFTLLDRYADNAPVKTKGKAKSRGRASTASRMSMQSVVSVVPSEPPSMNEISQMPADDDSIMTTGTTTSQAGGKTKKKPAAKPKGKGKKKAASVEPKPEAHSDVEYPDLGLDEQLPEIDDEDEIRVSVQPFVPAEREPVKPKRGRPKGSRNSKAAESSVVDISQPEAAPKKATRGRKPKAQPKPEPESEPEPEPEVEPEIPEDVYRQQSSEVDFQLQEELDQSMDLPDAESTPQALATKPKRGTKRTSDGLQKQDQNSSIVAGVEFPMPPKPTPVPKAKRGRKAKASEAVESDIDAPTQGTIVASQPERDTSMMSTDAEATKPPKTKKAPAKKGKARKASSTRSSKAIVVIHPDPTPEAEDLDRDEREIEAELERIAAEQEDAAIAAEQDRVAEFEPSPSRPTSSKHSQAAAHIHVLELELQHETAQISLPGQNMAEYVAHVAGTSASNSPNVVVFEDSPAPTPQKATPSPAQSDKENQPSSALPAPTTALKLQYSARNANGNPQIYLSPTKTTRIPLAPSTPNKSHPSPARHLSPSKQLQLQHLTSTHPWESIDIESLLLASPQPTPGRLRESLAAAAGAGGLSQRERGMTVEQWIYFQAEKGEQALRKRCEGLVEGFEREGVRGLEALQGIGVGGVV